MNLGVKADTEWWSTWLPLLWRSIRTHCTPVTPCAPCQTWRGKSKRKPPSTLATIKPLLWTPNVSVFLAVNTLKPDCCIQGQREIMYCRITQQDDSSDFHRSYRLTHSSQRMHDVTEIRTAGGCKSASSHGNIYLSMVQPEIKLQTLRVDR